MRDSGSSGRIVKTTSHQGVKVYLLERARVRVEHRAWSQWGGSVQLPMYLLRRVRVRVKYRPWDQWGGLAGKERGLCFTCIRQG